MCSFIREFLWKFFHSSLRCSDMPDLAPSLQTLNPIPPVSEDCELFLRLLKLQNSMTNIFMPWPQWAGGAENSPVSPLCTHTERGLKHHNPPSLSRFNIFGSLCGHSLFSPKTTITPQTTQSHPAEMLVLPNPSLRVFFREGLLTWSDPALFWDSLFFLGTHTHTHMQVNQQTHTNEWTPDGHICDRLPGVEVCVCMFVCVSASVFGLFYTVKQH